MATQSFSVEFTAGSPVRGPVGEYVVEWSKKTDGRRASSEGQVTVRPERSDPLEQIRDHLNGVDAATYTAVVSDLEPETEYGREMAGVPHA